MEATNVVSLDEVGDVEQENLEYSGLSHYVSEQYRRSKNHRLQDETRWLSSYRNYRGIYGPEVQFTDTEKSQAFVKITKTKVLAAYAQMTAYTLIQMLLQTKKLKKRHKLSTKYPEISFDQRLHGI